MDPMWEWRRSLVPVWDAEWCGRCGMYHVEGDHKPLMLPPSGIEVCGECRKIMAVHAWDIREQKWVCPPDEVKLREGEVLARRREIPVVKTFGADAELGTLRCKYCHKLLSSDGMCYDCLAHVARKIDMFALGAVCDA